LCSLSQTCFRKLFDGILGAILVNSDMDSAERASADLLLDDILIDLVLSTPIVLACDILRSSIEGFLLTDVSEGP